MVKVKGFIYVNGFALNSEGRVSIGDSPIFSFTKTRPVNALGDLSIGTTTIMPHSFSGGQGMDAVGRMLYVDIAGAARITLDYNYVGGMPYTNDGALIIDSVSPVHHYVGGVPAVASGAIAAGIGGATEPPTTDCWLYAVANENGTYWVTEDGKYVVMSKECHLPIPGVNVLVDESGVYIATEADELLTV
jgi:hypothetical protein